jgi:membrane-associated protease RseP (regulator of RpoE activity)
MVPRVAPRGVEPPQPPEAPEPARIERPKVMLGITMSEPGESLIEHLGLKEGETVLIDRVVEDLPAAKAGLKAKDIVISFDGVKPITESQIRDILRKKEPGDKVEVKVIRKGKEETLTIELAKYESSKLEMAAPQAWRVGGDENEWNNLEIPQIDAEQMRKQMEEAMRAVRGAGGDARGFFQGPDGKVQWLDLRKGEEARKAELDARMKEFDARMKEFDATMQKFHEQIASLQATLEKMNAQKKQP